MRKAIQLVFMGSDRKLKNLTYEDIRKELMNKLDFDFVIYDPKYGSVIKQECRSLNDISQPVTLGAMPGTKLGIDNSQAISQWSKNLQITGLFSTYIVDNDNKFPNTAVNGDTDLILASFTDIATHGSLQAIDAGLIVISDDSDYMLAGMLTDAW